jgi:hypothetical protein
MTKRPIRLPSDDPPFLDLFSHGRVIPQRASHPFTAAQIEQIRRTVRRTPEVMVKVTGGGRKIGVVAAHFAYISHHGELALETDNGQQVHGEGQRELFRSWHLELSRGQYRQRNAAGSDTPEIKLVHNITLSMPAPTPSKAVLAAAKVFAREKFGAQYPYAMALHTHQPHPHVHLVVKAEAIDGRRLRIDKAMLREWRQDFAQMMRDQGIAANATSRSARGQTKRATKNVFYRPRRRGDSYALQEEIYAVKEELSATGTVSDPARPRLLKTRNAIVAAWDAVASKLESEGDLILAGDVRYFARHLPPVLTDRERLAAKMLELTSARKDRVRDRILERTR